jgi:hypothetical protein
VTTGNVQVTRLFRGTNLGAHGKLRTPKALKKSTFTVFTFGNARTLRRH